MREISYEPRSVREVLVELKDTAELAVDLAYSAILYRDQELAAEVLDLEERVEYLQYHARIALMLAAKTAEDGERLVGIFQVVEGTVAVTEAAADVAGLLRSDVGLPEELAGALPEAHEPVVRATVGEGSALSGTPVGTVEIDTGVRVVAVRRDGTWLVDPEEDDRVLDGDVIFGRGPPAGADEVYERATGRRRPTEDAESDIEGLERAVETVVEMKNVSELALGLSYSAALFDSDAMADEVQVLESRSDALQEELGNWVIDAVPRVEEPRRLRGLLRIAVASEAISDAALGIADVVMRDIDLHPVFGQAVRRSNETITAVRIESGSDLDGETAENVEVETRTGMAVLAVRREDGWVYDPGEGTTLYADDVVIVRGPRAGEDRLRALATADEADARQ